MKFKTILIPVLAILAKISIAVPSIALPALVWPTDADPMSKKVNNSDLRGALITSGKFKVVETPPNFNLNNYNSVQPTSLDSSAPAIQDNLNYILIGQVQSTRWFENSSSNYQGSDYIIAYKKNEILVSYKLINLKDKSSVAAFTVNATGKQTVTLQPGQKFNADVGQIIQDTSQDLATKVMEQLNSQLAGKGIIDRPVITGIKTYDD